MGKERASDYFAREIDQAVELTTCFLCTFLVLVLLCMDFLLIPTNLRHENFQKIIGMNEKHRKRRCIKLLIAFSRWLVFSGSALPPWTCSASNHRRRLHHLARRWRRRPEDQRHAFVSSFDRVNVVRQSRPEKLGHKQWREMCIFQIPSIPRRTAWVVDWLDPAYLHLRWFG